MALTRTESSHENLVVYSTPDATYRAVQSAFEVVGKVKTTDARFRRVVGRISSGTARMNAATVTASVQPLADAGCRIEIQATAQEGLIKQHTAPRAVSRLLERLAKDRALRTTPPKADDTRPCPWCGEEIKKAARICRYCNRDVV